jgi:hypothetical protein
MGYLFSIALGNYFSTASLPSQKAFLYQEKKAFVHQGGHKNDINEEISSSTSTSSSLYMAMSSRHENRYGKIYKSCHMRRVVPYTLLDEKL